MIIKLYTIGGRNNSYKKHIDEYLKRMPEVTLISVKDETRIPETYIALSEEGKIYSSKEFSKFIKNIDQKEINFVIGPATGLSDSIKKNAKMLISLSKMTFPHELAALLAIEQIYRAKSILAGTPYHK